MSGNGSATAHGLLLEPTEQGIFFVARYVGEANVPQDVNRRRRSVYDAMRRMGSPVLIKKMFTANDVTSGVAERSPNFDAVYGQTRNEDPISHGVGFVSVAKSDDEWIAPDGASIVRGEVSPGAGYVPAPRYRGFGPGFLTYLIEPDAATDFFKVEQTGVLIKIQTATAQAPWFPDISDNDLVINVHVDGQFNVLDSFERYQAKMTNPVSVRGIDRRGRKEYSEEGTNRHVLNQSFEMTLLPDNNTLMHVEVDR